MRDLQNEKREHPYLPHSPHSEVEGVRIVVISFRNIAKKKLRKIHLGFLARGRAESGGWEFRR